MGKIELLAPAGDLERLKIAFLYGADAVYVGGLFNLRANTPNFSFEDLKEGVEYAHEIGKKVYVTVNIALHNKEYVKVRDYLIKLKEICVDGIIVSDPAIIDLNKGIGLVIHLSTQASTLNKEATLFWKDEGVSRVVLARECSKNDILDIKSTGIETEVFIHGAMCASYSGRCVLSNYLTNRDSNRGGCSQICRWDFDLYNDDDILEGDRPFTFCCKDLSMAEYVPELIDMEVDSLKIEGRMRSIYYIATVVKVYRKIIDEYCNDKDNYEYNLEYDKLLEDVANRECICQFFDGNFGKNVQYYNGRREITNQDFIGMVLGYDESSGRAKVEQRNYFEKGDFVEVFGPDSSFKFVIDEIYDIYGNEIDVVRHPKQIVYLKVPLEALENYMIKCIDKRKNL